MLYALSYVEESVMVETSVDQINFLFYWRILPPIVRGFAWALEHTLGVGGAVGLSTAANIFLGMVESPCSSDHTFRGSRAANCSW